MAVKLARHCRPCTSPAHRRTAAMCRPSPDPVGSEMDPARSARPRLPRLPPPPSRARAPARGRTKLQPRKNLPGTSAHGRVDWRVDHVQTVQRSSEPPANARVWASHARSGLLQGPARQAPSAALLLSSDSSRFPSLSPSSSLFLSTLSLSQRFAGDNAMALVALKAAAAGPDP